MKRSRFSNSRLAVLIFVLASCMVAAPSIALPENPRTLLTQADRLHREGHYAEALAALERAYAQQPLPRLLLNLAFLHEKLGHIDQARSHYERYLKEEESPPAPLRDRAQAGLTRVRQSAGASGQAAPAASRYEKLETTRPAPRPALPSSSTAATAAAPPPLPSSGAALRPASAPALPPLVAPKPMVAQRPPIYRRWWFWAALGGAAAVAAGAAVGVSLARSDPPDTYRLEF